MHTQNIKIIFFLFYITKKNNLKYLSDLTQKTTFLFLTLFLIYK